MSCPSINMVGSLSGCLKAPHNRLQPFAILSASNLDPINDVHAAPTFCRPA